jgi:hypothetical protein
VWLNSVARIPPQNAPQFVSSQRPIESPPGIFLSATDERQAHRDPQ